MSQYLTNCRHCQKEVSKEAKACPHCGADAPAMGNTSNAAVKVIAAIISMALMVYAFSQFMEADRMMGDAQRDLERAQRMLR